MAISYEPLFKTLKEKGVSQYYLIQAGVNNETLHRLRHNISVSAHTLDNLCQLLRCPIEDVMKCILDE